MLNVFWNSLLLSACLVTCLSSSSGLISPRKRRHLLFPTGTAIELVVGFGLPVVVQEQSLTLGTVIKFSYRGPMNASDFSSSIFSRKSRSKTRWEMYSRLEAGTESLGMDGKACMLRTICEAADVTVRYNGLAGELLHVLLTPSSTSEPQRHYLDREYYAAERLGATVPGSCHLLYPECNTGLLDIISTIEII